ncbi:MAG: GNAT family N-acetyltransferase [Alkalispirochaeta sp.]
MQYDWHQSMAAIDRHEWNGLAAVSPTALMTHEWLEHLEESGSITPENGWTPSHLTVREADAMVAAVPLYIRTDSWGEFVFDFAFAEVAGELGSSYYPKMVGMSPASPSPTFGFLTTPGREDELAAPILTAIEQFCRDNEISVLQFNFVLPEWQDRLKRLGMTTWEHHGYAWYNENFMDFEDYLSRFRKNQRRNIRRERASMEDQGIALRMVAAGEAPEHYFQRMEEYYLRTNAQFGPFAARFLTGEFFTEMPAAVREHAWFSVAVDTTEADGDGFDLSADPLALAFLVRKGDRVLGRYWGAREERPNLHFNVCYYTPIEWAIAEGIKIFDPGMGSEHKVRRGFRSVPTYSLHRFFDRHMQAILNANMDRINSYERAQISMLDEAVPYKNPSGNGPR